jgi:HTH-type transcriptional regulator/antitoxin HipB
VRTALELGALIRERRRTLELSQQALAERVGVSRPWVVEMERGKEGAAVGLVLRTLDALGLRLNVGPERDHPSRQETKKAMAVAVEPDIDDVVRRARRLRR